MKQSGSLRDVYGSKGNLYGSKGNLTGSKENVGPSASSLASTNDRSRIMDKAWEEVQKKTFTKWVNTKLHARGLTVKDLGTELTDGVSLIQLLEIIGDEPVGKYNKSAKLRIQQVENINAALGFIKRHGVNLTNIGAEDIVDGNEKLILGMIWTIILRFTIADISEEGLFAKEGLLLWCQRKTAPYNPEVNVKDFTFSWQDGLAFCALIHRHRPDLLDFHSLNKADKRGNMALAFDVAAKHLDIPKLLDVEDVVDLVKPDERSVMTYVAQYFHAFSELDKVEVAGRRVNKFAQVMASVLEMQNDYEKRAAALLASLRDQMRSWDATTIASQYSDAKKQSNDFNDYKNTTKREWVAEKRELDALLGNIQTKLSTYRLAAYHPPAEMSLAQVDANWKQLLQKEGEHKRAINAKIKTIKEQLQNDFANVANDLQAKLNDLSKSVSSLDGDLDAQSDQVAHLQKGLPQLGEVVEKLRVLGRDCVAANIEENEFTIYSVEDIEFELQVVSSALSKKQAFIDNQKVARQMTNVTRQQLDEFESTFRHFDTDDSNSLSSIEFKASLAGLGFAYTDAEFDEIFKRVSQNRVEVTFEQFVPYMTSIMEDKTSPDQLAAAFKSLANSKDYFNEQDLQKAHVNPEIIEHLKQAVQPTDKGYDYNAYLQKCFGV